MSVSEEFDPTLKYALAIQASRECVMANVLTSVMTRGKIEHMNGTQIRTLREEAVLSQEALARNLGVAVRTVARWESGNSKPSPLAIEKLNGIFRLSSLTKKRP